MPKSITDLIKEYFMLYPNQDLPHGPVVDWVSEQYLLTHNSPPRDPWRAIRNLSQKGFLIKVRKGVYRYDPDYIQNRTLYDFSPEDKEIILKRDGYRCVICGRGEVDGVSLCVDHIKPKDKGGTNSIDNGQTLCGQHNLQKKNYSQTEAGKRYFIRLFNKAKQVKDSEIVYFCKRVFDVYDEMGIDDHIERPDK